jgi:hypothetical protein
MCAKDCVNTLFILYRNEQVGAYWRYELCFASREVEFWTQVGVDVLIRGQWQWPCDRSGEANSDIPVRQAHGHKMRPGTAVTRATAASLSVGSNVHTEQAVCPSQRTRHWTQTSRRRSPGVGGGCAPPHTHLPPSPIVPSFSTTPGHRWKSRNGSTHNARARWWKEPPSHSSGAARVMSTSRSAASRWRLYDRVAADGGSVISMMGAGVAADGRWRWRSRRC